jgi:hypothetical protein
LPASAFKPGSAGSVNIAGPKGAMSMNVDTPYSQAVLGAINGFDPPNPNLPSIAPQFLDPGNYTVSAPGASPPNGLAVGSFSAQIGVPGVLDFTNRYAFAQTLDRTQSLTVNWTGGDPNGYVLISGISISAISPKPGPHANFYCVEHASAGTFTVPDYVVLSMPPTFDGQLGGFQFGLAVGQLGATRFTASGLDVGLLRYNVTLGRTLGWK